MLGKLRLKIRLALMPLFMLFLLAQPLWAEQWALTNCGILSGISGMSLLSQVNGQTSFVIVHDNKHDKEGRTSILRVGVNNRTDEMPLKWPDEKLPVDLKAVSRVPRTQSSFVAMESKGTAYHFQVDAAANEIKLVNKFSVPDYNSGFKACKVSGKPEFEGFALQEVDSQMIAVWAHRGQDKEPAVLFWSNFNVETDGFSNTQWKCFKVPYPTKDVRHISDMTVDRTGTLFISSASDAGDDGPFISAFYMAGTFSQVNGNFTFRENKPLIELSRFDNHKIEAVEYAPGGFRFGTDDENFGGSISLATSQSDDGNAPLISDRLYFGTDIKGIAMVSKSDWASFLGEVVTPRFPYGLTFWKAQGQWLGANGSIVKEPSYILELLHPDTGRQNQAVAEIIKQYKCKFSQEAVLQVTTQVKTNLE